MNNWRFVNCIDISLIFQCILLPLLLTHYFRLPFTQIWTKSTYSSDSCKYRLFVFFIIIYGTDYAEKTQRWNKQMFCFIALCILYVLNLLLNGSDNIKPFSPLGYLFMLCDFLFFFFMKVPFDMSFSVLRKYTIPHSLLLYSVHVKWILICVQNVDKDENTLDYITLYTTVLCDAS